MKMSEFMLLPIPAGDYNALGITPNSILQTYVTPDGTLQIRAVTQGELEEFICGSDCESCPVAQEMGSPQNEVLWGEEERRSGRIPPIYRRCSLAESATTSDGECFACPCYANCDDSDYAPKEGACKSNGSRREF
jgi:hypothetical protein